VTLHPNTGRRQRLTQNTAAGPMLSEFSPTRQEILSILKRQEATTIAELSALVGIAPTGVRQHLAHLERQDYVASTSVRQKQGRPVTIYRLTDKADELFPAGYRSLLDRVLGKVEGLYGGEAVKLILSSIMDDLLEVYAGQMETADLGEKVQRLADLRSEEGYMCCCREEEDGFVLLEQHCPILDVAKDHRQICQLELELFGKLLGAKVEREQHILEGEAQCVYRVKKPSRPFRGHG